MPLSTSSNKEAAARYPDRPAARDRWILQRRGPRNPVDPFRAVAAFVEDERTERGDIAPVATIFLANRECPWRCLMCDLWKNTTEQGVPPGAIPAQIHGALAALPAARRVKLYNSGSFFDPRAIPPEDHGEIASLLAGFERVIVESHPALVGDSCRRLRDLLDADLEVAMGLETAHPEALAMLNKRMTLADFRRAAQRLASDGIGLRVFVLLGLPLVPAAEAVFWVRRSLETAFDAGATAVTIIPTRTGNGALEALAEQGEFTTPALEDLEETVAFGIALGRGRVFADLWDLEKLRRCAACYPARAERLRVINRTQVVPPSVSCARCTA
ncbi:MAG TPA: radical SAM protein [Thermoanaerobaculia bacterium]|nr:radical SAM protein [Thermoanaerobaculia bacterium]